MDRNRGNYRTSIEGIAGNVFLSAVKYLIGTAANSVSIRADAVNNMSDALSSIITIIGVRLSRENRIKSTRSDMDGLNKFRR